MVLNEKKSVSKFDEDFIKNYDENSDEVYIFKVKVKCPKNLHDFRGDLPLLAEIIKILKKCNKLACNIYDKENYGVHIRSIKQALNHGIILKRYLE